MFVQLVKLYDSPKKYKMIFYDDDRKKVKTTNFGASGSSDYTINRDKDRRQRYLDRHRKREKWDRPMTPGSLSRFILWNMPTIKSSFADYRARFKFKLY